MLCHCRPDRHHSIGSSRPGDPAQQHLRSTGPPGEHYYLTYMYLTLPPWPWHTAYLYLNSIASMHRGQWASHPTSPSGSYAHESVGQAPILRIGSLWNHMVSVLFLIAMYILPSFSMRFNGRWCSAKLYSEVAIRAMATVRYLIPLQMHGR